jgi:hypothetical protein
MAIQLLIILCEFRIDPKKLLVLAAAAEAAMGVALVVDPSFVIHLLLGANLTGLEGPAAVGVVIGRVTGIALIALGVSCWPGSTALSGMLTYSVLMTLYLAALGLGGVWVGVLLWPAVALHAVMSVLLARMSLRHRPKGN